jgi:hypothetical protein
MTVPRRLVRRETCVIYVRLSSVLYKIRNKRLVLIFHLDRVARYFLISPVRLERQIVKTGVNNGKVATAGNVAVLYSGAIAAPPSIYIPQF